MVGPPRDTGDEQQRASPHTILLFDAEVFFEPGMVDILAVQSAEQVAKRARCTKPILLNSGFAHACV